MPVVLVTEMTEGREARWRAVLAAALPEETIVRALEVRDAEACDIAIVANPRPEQLAPFRRLRFVQSLWAGVEQIVQNPALRRDVPLARLVDPTMSRTMAEAVVAHVMALHRTHPHYRRAQDEARWTPAPVITAGARTVGFLGTGELARAALAMLAGIGFSRLAWSRRAKALDGVETFSGAEGLRSMLARTDILVNLLPLTDATRGLVDADLLTALAPAAGFVNVARGAHVIDADLLAALDEGRIGEAVLDVFRDEPLPVDHPFWHHPRVQVFPHVAAPTELESAAAIAAANVRAFRSGKPVTGLVDRTLGY